MHKHPSSLRMQLKDPVYTSCVHLHECSSFPALQQRSLSQFELSAAAVLEVSLLHTGVSRAQQVHDGDNKTNGVKKTPED